MSKGIFRFKQFEIDDEKSAMKLGVDGVLLGAWLKFNSPTKILDVGTGSGVIALQMTQRFPNSIVTGIESNENAFNQTEKNFNNSPWQNRLKLIRKRFQEFSEKDFDVIVCNPPFYKGDSLKDTPDRHEARSETFLPMDDFFLAANNCLAEKGSIFLVYPSIFEEELIAKAFIQNFHPNNIVYIKGHENAKTKRIMIEFSRSKSVVLKENLVIRQLDNKFTKEYSAIVKDFYIIL